MGKYVKFVKRHGQPHTSSKSIISKWRSKECWRDTRKEMLKEDRALIRRSKSSLPSWKGIQRNGRRWKQTEDQLEGSWPSSRGKALLLGVRYIYIYIILFIFCLCEKMFILFIIISNLQLFYWSVDWEDIHEPVKHCMSFTDFKD